MWPQCEEVWKKKEQELSLLSWSEQDLSTNLVHKFLRHGNILLFNDQLTPLCLLHQIRSVLKLLASTIK